MALMLHLAALVACLLLAARVARVRASPSRRWFLLFVLAVSWWAATATVAHAVDSEAWFLRLSQLSFVGIVAVPVLWYGFVDGFVRGGGRRRRRTALLAIVPALTLALVAYGPSELVIAAVRSGPAAGDGFDLVRGPWYWLVHLPYTYGLLGAGVWRMLAYSRLSTRPARHQAVVVVVAILVPLLANAAERSGLVALDRGDLTVMAFTVAALLIGWALLARRFLELTPADYRGALEAHGHVLVVDGRARVVDANRAAARLLGIERDTDPIPLGRILPSLAAALRRMPEVGGTIEVVTPNLPSRRTRVHVLPVPSVGGGPPGGHVLTILLDEAEGEAAPDRPTPAGGA